MSRRNSNGGGGGGVRDGGTRESGRSKTYKHVHTVCY